MLFVFQVSLERKIHCYFKHRSWYCWVTMADIYRHIGNSLWPHSSVNWSKLFDCSGRWVVKVLSWAVGKTNEKTTSVRTVRFYSSTLLNRCLFVRRVKAILPPWLFYFSKAVTPFRYCPTYCIKMAALVGCVLATGMNISPLSNTRILVTKMPALHLTLTEIPN